MRIPSQLKRKPAYKNCYVQAQLTYGFAALISSWQPQNAHFEVWFKTQDGYPSPTLLFAVAVHKLLTIPIKALLDSTTHHHGSTWVLDSNTQWLYLTLLHSNMILLEYSILIHNGSTWLYYTLPWLYFTLLHYTIMTLLDSTLQHSIMAILDSTTLYHSSTWLPLPRL